jgi:hypothetical protein
VRLFSNSHDMFLGPFCEGLKILIGTSRNGGETQQIIGVLSLQFGQIFALESK